MWNIIKRKSDGMYLKKFKPSIIDNCEWTDNLEDAQSLVIGMCELFKRRFEDVEIEIIKI
jgi:hypothetical protein